MALTVLILEDDTHRAQALIAQMKMLGHQPLAVGNGPAVLAAVRDDAFDLVILDRVMAGPDSVAAVRDLRTHGLNLPVMMLADDAAAARKVEGLEAGADDYLARPIDMAELNARLHALVRARQWSATSSDDTIRVGEIVVSPTKYRAWRDGRALDLPRTELRLLTELARHAGSVLTRPMLLQRVWNYDAEPTTNIVDTYIKRLRKKLTERGGDDPITTLRGVGYMLRK